MTIPGTSAQAAARLDTILRGGLVYDGSGRPPRVADVAIAGDRIVAVGALTNAVATVEIDVSGLAVAPGFINMLSWANESLLVDGRSEGGLRQGVTLEVMGEGTSMGPLTEAMQADLRAAQGDLQYEVRWNTLGGYLDVLVRQGVSCNVASFVGATTVRVHELGHANRRPTAAELARMRVLVRDALREGAVGLSSSLIYAPAFYAGTDELAALASVVGELGGLYISHLRSEGSRLAESLEELLHVARVARVPVEVYHLKAAGPANWGKMDAVLARIEAARASGIPVTADMYCYTAAATGLDAAMPPWVQEGGLQAWVQRLRQPAVRARVVREMSRPATTWENFFDLAGSPTNILLTGFRTDALKPLTGRTLADVARERGRPAAEVALDLVIEDVSRVETVYFLMSEENLRKQVRRPWVSFGSDAASMSPEGVFLRSNTHPRAYGNVARLLGRYVREEQLIPLEEAVRRLTSLPAANLRLDRRGALQAGFYADVVVFNAGTVRDLATYERPHQLSEGVEHVFVNGAAVIRGGRHTGAKPGRVVRGPAYAGPGAR